MTIRALLQNEPDHHRVLLHTNDAQCSLSIPPKPSGSGSSVNGGKLLLLALATCYCNDLYREAAVLGIEVRGIEVEVAGEFGGVGEPAKEVSYRAKVVVAGTSEQHARRLLARTDAVAEVHNTLRVGVAVRLSGADVEIVD